MSRCRFQENWTGLWGSWSGRLWEGIVHPAKTRHEVQPDPRTIRDRNGNPCDGTRFAPMPLSGVCMKCPRAITLVSLSADWYHTPEDSGSES
jgi:hypothetical protein